jgi:hypothetical protein
MSRFKKVSRFAITALLVVLAFLLPAWGLRERFLE